MANRQSGLKSLYYLSAASSKLKSPQSFAKSMQGIFRSIESLVNDTIKTMVDNWLLGENKKLAILTIFSKMQTGLTATTEAEKKAIKAAAAAEGKAIETVTAKSTITTDAAKAAAGAYSAVSSIPVIGPLLAPIAATVAFAGVEAFGSFVSAAGGWDIPSNINPVTQLDAKEMVLPANLSDRIRSMTDAGGGRRGGDVHVHISAMDSQDVERALSNNQGALSRAFRGLCRDGHLRLR